MTPDEKKEIISKMESIFLSNKFDNFYEKYIKDFRIARENEIREKIESMFDFIFTTRMS